MTDISSFYGITTTTLVVLSSATLALFQFFSNSAREDIDSCEKKLKNITNSSGHLNCSDNSELQDDALIILTVTYDNIKTSNYC